MQLSDKCMKKYFNSLVVKDMIYKTVIFNADKRTVKLSFI